MKRKISIFISMILLTVTMALGFTVNAKAETEELPAAEYSKEYAEMTAIGFVAEFNNTAYLEELKYLADDQNIRNFYGENYDKIKGIYESRGALQEEFGRFSGFIGEPVFEEDKENGIVKVTITANYENGPVAFTIPMDTMMYQVFEDDIKIEKTEVAGESKSMGESMKEAGLNTLMGIGIVFAMLIVISFVISLFKLISRPEKKKEAVTPVKAPEPVAVVESEDVTDDCEIVAVITAAIMASIEEAGEEVPADGLVVRSIRRRKLRA